MRHDLRYTASTVFDSFPWPQAPSQASVVGVVQAVADLLDLRADRLKQGIPVGRQYASLRDHGRNPLRDRHTGLDAAVVAAYGFDPDEDALTQLMALNEDTATSEAQGRVPRGPGAGGLPDTTATTALIEPPGPS